MELDSYLDAGVPASVGLVNALASANAAGEPEQRLAAIRSVVAIDPPSVATLRPADLPGFLAVAQALRRVFDDLDHGDVDRAAARLNELLARYPAHPHLAREAGSWRLHHHPMDSALVPMWAAICAEAMARMIGAGYAGRFGVCDAPDCDDVYFDQSRNGSRRFCSTTCQNRIKASEFRRRQSGRP